MNKYEVKTKDRQIVNIEADSYSHTAEGGYTAFYEHIIVTDNCLWWKDTSIRYHTVATFYKPIYVKLIQ